MLKSDVSSACLTCLLVVEEPQLGHSVLCGD